ncbi:hypothetical protein [Thermaurantiacus sp.]
MKRMMRVAVAAALCALAPAALAQGGTRAMRAQSDIYAGMSAEGRKIMSEAMLQGSDANVRDQWLAAHERMLAILERDPLDRDALAAAMREQGRMLDEVEAKRREAMLRGFSLLSAADRKAWAANDRARRQAAMGPGRLQRGGMAP